MITIEQAKIIGNVLKHFNSGEALEWNEIDDCMESLAWITDTQLVIETEIVLNIHADGNARCNKNHPSAECMVPIIIDAVTFIVDDFKDSKRLAKKARYVLEYYLTFTQVGEILTKI